MRLNVRLFLALAVALLPVLLAAWQMDVSASTLTGLAWMALISSLLGSFLYSRLLARSARALLRRTEQVGAGNFEGVTRDPLPGDFLGLNDAFNQMVDSLRSRDQELQVLNHELARRVRELNALYEVSQSVNSTLDVQEVLRTILNETVKTFPNARKALIHLLDESGERLIPYALSDSMREPETWMGLPLNKGIAGYVVRKNRPVTIPDTAQDPRFLDRGSNVRSLMVTPLSIGKTVIGALSLDSAQRHTFTPDMEVVFRSLGNRAAIALENARLYSDSQKRVAELTSLYQSAIELAGNQSRASLHDRLVTLAFNMLDPASALLFLADPGRHGLRVAATRGLPDEALNHYHPLAEQIFRTGKPQLKNAAVMLPETIHLPSSGGNREESVLAVPLIWEHQVLGVLQLCRTPQQPRFDAADVRLLTLFAQQAASTLENTRLIEALQAKTAELEAVNRDLSRASRLKSEFLANMSHELRTPLNSILGFSEILIDQAFGELNERQERYMLNINRSGQHLLDLINDILDLSKIEAGRMELLREPFQLEGMLHEVQTLVEPLAAKKSLMLTLDSNQAAPQVVADRLRIKQVLYNLVSNAVKFTPSGGAIHIRAWSEDDGTLCVSVSDTGIGIPEEDREQVFDLFHRLDHAYRRETEGTGLGLALVRRFMELHGGQVSVTSEVGRGSTFTITLPPLPFQAEPMHQDVTDQDEVGSLLL